MAEELNLHRKSFKYTKGMDAILGGVVAFSLCNNANESVAGKHTIKFLKR